jgi:hypothetical protein
MIPSSQVLSLWESRGGSEIHYTADVTAAVKKLEKQQIVKAA